MDQRRDTGSNRKMNAKQKGKQKTDRPGGEGRESHRPWWGRWELGSQQEESRITFLAPGSFTEPNWPLAVDLVDAVRIEWWSNPIRCWYLCNFLRVFVAGLFFVLPCTDSFIKVDMRTVSFDIPPQEVRRSLAVNNSRRRVGKRSAMRGSAV